MKRLRPALFAGLVLAALGGTAARGHDDHEHHAGATHYAVIDDFHANPSTTDATGEIFLKLNHYRTKLHYKIVLDGQLGLKPNPADRTEPDDIIGMHIHLNVPELPGGVGPHILNIFGLATYDLPAEEDADLVIDYEHNTLRGTYDISDATLNPATGQPQFQFFQLTTKIIYNWLDELDNGELMLGVHTNESGFPTMAIHGHIARVIPEPASGMLVVAGVLFWRLTARIRRAGRATC